MIGLFSLNLSTETGRKFLALPYLLLLHLAAQISFLPVVALLKILLLLLLIMLFSFNKLNNRL